MTKSKEELRLLGDHLQGNPRRKFGTQNGKLIECRKHQAFYPDNEDGCPDCLSWVEICDRAVDNLKLDLQPSKPAVDEYDDDEPTHPGYWP